MHGVSGDRLRGLPQVQKVLETDDAIVLLRTVSRPLLTNAVRQALDAARATLLAGARAAPTSPEAILSDAMERLARAQRPVLRRTINATGIILHTNLGRAPLAPEAVAAMSEAAAATNLEFDLESGTRGERLQGIEPILCELTGAEAAVAANNNAAAVLLALSATAAGGEIIVSRGELVEIGGGFRIPDMIRQSGAALIEVGTTNKTRLSDYEAAITDRTRVLLKVHQSNYRIAGFTAEVSAADLAALARLRGLLSMIDLGSGTILDLSVFGRRYEPTVRESVASGADLVAFSGDKLLGGPQAGLVVGTKAAIAPLRKHPLMRAMRLDKVTLAALEATLRLYRDPADALRIPTVRMLAQTPDVIGVRADRLLALVGDAADARLEATEGFCGGGSLPDDTIDSRGVSVAVADLSAADLARALRLRAPAIVARVQNDRVLFDVLAVGDAEVPEIADAVRAVAQDAVRA